MGLWTFQVVSMWPWILLVSSHLCSSYFLLLTLILNFTIDINAGRACMVVEHGDILIPGAPVQWPLYKHGPGIGDK
ncbi:hypothetical protein EV426DRAFT_615834 [Tirmania nivea]|nr:hypothetical protein EV426DRAFT_615834 [Tirmania nivea]